MTKTIATKETGFDFNPTAPNAQICKGIFYKYINGTLFYAYDLGRFDIYARIEAEQMDTHNKIISYYEYLLNKKRDGLIAYIQKEIPMYKTFTHKEMVQIANTCPRIKKIRNTFNRALLGY